MFFHLLPVPDKENGNIQKTKGLNSTVEKQKVWVIGILCTSITIKSQHIMVTNLSVQYYHQFLLFLSTFKPKIINDKP